MVRVAVDARSVTSRRSGIGNYVEALLDELVPLAPDLDFLLLKNPDRSAPLAAGARVEERVFPGETKSVRTVFELGRALASARCELYHSPADLVPLGLSCPYVVTIHDLMWLEARRLASSFLPVRLANGLWYTANITRAIRGARRVIAISEATAAAIGRVFPEHLAKVRVVRHGLDLARYDPSRAGPRRLLDGLVPPGVRFSLIVGQGSPYKNHAGMVRAFVEAARNRPDERLVLVRRFSRVDFEMKRLLARPEVREKVLVVPFVSDEHLLALYRYARQVLFVSHYEGFGLPALEAMALGTPVLASTAPAVREVTGDGALHVASTDHAAMVAAIRRLSDDEALRDALTAAGRRRAATFSWRRAAEQTLAVYREALER
ncbi:MAG: glycosyltransferase family 1 protein [Sorangiineae bacterium]|nr:glycosyltransferase family 1 protein [Polyangiaceae bacterium]MEB2324443.1 glycosyltransferase family 1 protein [Sorangiineae bacterium]